jgi:hypothetical protein
MDDISRMHPFESTEELVEEILIMLLSKFLAALENLVKICFHQSFDQIQLGEVGGRVVNVTVDKQRDLN